jgi:hypothetical protein
MQRYVECGVLTGPARFDFTPKDATLEKREFHGALFDRDDQ